MDHTDTLEKRREETDTLLDPKLIAISIKTAALNTFTEVNVFKSDAEGNESTRTCVGGKSPTEISNVGSNSCIVAMGLVLRCFPLSAESVVMFLVPLTVLWYHYCGLIANMKAKGPSLQTES